MNDLNKKSLLLSVQNLSVGLKYKDQSERILTHGISFDLYKGEILALVGESGSGKTITSLACMGFYPNPHGFAKSGQVNYLGQNWMDNSEKEWQAVRGKEVAMIFQEPASALNPLYTIQSQLKECLDLHPNTDAYEIEALLKRVGFNDPQRVLKAYPHELSGGMQQRVMIAMALIHKPKILIADEPTTALDVTIQAQIMDLLLDLQTETQMSILFVTHNLPLVYQYCDRLIVLKDGREVEQNKVVDFFENPQMDYSKELLNAIPKGSL